MTSKFVLRLLAKTAVFITTGMLVTASVATGSASWDISTDNPRTRTNLVATLGIMYIPFGFEGDTNPQQAMVDMLNREQLNRKKKELNPSKVITDMSGKKPKSNTSQQVTSDMSNRKQLNEDGTLRIMFVPLN